MGGRIVFGSSVVVDFEEGEESDLINIYLRDHIFKKCSLR